jgi:hypothetical protein
MLMRPLYAMFVRLFLFVSLLSQKWTWTKVFSLACVWGSKQTRRTGQLKARVRVAPSLTCKSTFHKHAQLLGCRTRLCWTGPSTSMYIEAQRHKINRQVEL